MELVEKYASRFANSTARFNRKINIKLITEKTGISNLSVKCPQYGRKPDITITGTLISCDIMGSFQVRIKGLYIKNLSDYSKIEIEAGYDKQTLIKMKGQILNIYVDKPAPDREVVINCQTGYFSTWTSATCDIKAKKGTPLASVVKEICNTFKSDDSVFPEPYISTTVTESLNADFVEIGYSKDVLHKLISMYRDNDIMLSTNDGQIRVWKTTDKIAPKRIGQLMSPPQYNGATLTIQMLWNTNLTPGDLFHFSTQYFIKGENKLDFDQLSGTFRIWQIKYEFSTVKSINTMTVLASKA